MKRLSTCRIGTGQRVLNPRNADLRGDPSEEYYEVRDARITTFSEGLARVRGEVRRRVASWEYRNRDDWEDYSDYPKDWPWKVSERPWYSPDRYRKGRYYRHPDFDHIEIVWEPIDIVVPACEVSGIPAEEDPHGA